MCYGKSKHTINVVDIKLETTSDGRKVARVNTKGCLTKTVFEKSAPVLYQRLEQAIATNTPLILESK